VCGDKNESGLKIEFYYEAGKAIAEYSPTQNFEGYRDFLHGGIISTLLDEVMIKSILAQGILAITSQIDVKFRCPAKTGEKLLLEGKIKEDRRRIILTEGKISKQDGTVIAEGTGKFFRTEEKLKQQLERCLVE
jgi:uncharacterized protein (TIGR00369 family)